VTCSFSSEHICCRPFRLAVPCWLDHGPLAASGSRWVQLAPLPSRLTDSHSALPPIRIHSELKGPEAVVIDTSGFGLLPMLPEDESAAAPSQLPSSDVADVAKQPGRQKLATAARLAQRH
jgi:hypothetical protein